MKFAAIFSNVCFLAILPFAIRFVLFYELFSELTKWLGDVPEIRILYYIIMTFPFVIIVSNLVSWVYFYRKNYRLAFFISLLPLISAALFFIRLSIPIK